MADQPTTRVKLMLSPYGDHAVRTLAEDALNRAPFAEAIAAQIASTDPEQEVVFGIVGSWGSGKTSLLNMIAEYLRKDHGGFLVLTFNPWLFSGAEHLVGIFFSELGAQLGDLEEAPWQDLGQAMKDFGTALGILRSAPGQAKWLGVAGKGLEAGGERAKGTADEGASLLERKERLGTALEKAEKRILIVVDDLDRLRQQEIREVVAFVRLNADLPNLTFVLSYDRFRLEQALGEEEGDGRSYLEKIVQVVHDVPETRDVDLNGSLVDAVSTITDAASRFGPYDPDRVIVVFRDIVFPLVRTMRDVRRYTNVLPVTLRTVSDEVALADVLGLEAIRLFMPDVYGRLSVSAAALTTTSDVYPLVGNAERDKQLIQELIEAGGNHRSVVEVACTLLFPASQKHLQNVDSNSSQASEWGKERRVANWRVLRFFLDKQLPQDVLPVETVQDVFDSLGDPSGLRELLDRMDLKTLDRLLLRLQEYASDFRPSEVVEALVVISNRFARLMEDAGRSSDLSADVSYGGLVSVMLRRIQDPEELARQVKAAMPKIDSLSARLQVVTVVGHRPNTGEWLVPEADADELEEHLLTEIENKSAESLANEYNINRLLFRARQTDEERGKEVIMNIVSHDDAFMASLLRFYQRSTTGIQDGQIGERQPVLWWNQVCSLFGEETAKRRVEELRDQRRPEDLGEPAGEALQLAASYASGEPPDWEKT